MRVFPAAEGSLHLHIPKLPACDVAGMHRHPSSSKRKRSHFKHHARPVLDSAGMFDNAYRLPGRDQLL